MQGINVFNIGQCMMDVIFFVWVVYSGNYKDGYVIVWSEIGGCWDFCGSGYCCGIVVGIFVMGSFWKVIQVWIKIYGVFFVFCIRNF